MANILCGVKRTQHEYDLTPKRRLKFQRHGACTYSIEFDPPRSCMLDVTKGDKYQPIKKYKAANTTCDIRIYTVLGLDSIIFITGYHCGNQFDMLDCYESVERAI
jgi:hypothetical protein